MVMIMTGSSSKLSLMYVKLKCFHYRFLSILSEKYANYHNRKKSTIGHAWWFTCGGGRKQSWTAFGCGAWTNLKSLVPGVFGMNFFQLCASPVVEYGSVAGHC